MPVIMLVQETSTHTTHMLIFVIIMLDTPFVMSRNSSHLQYVPAMITKTELHNSNNLQSKNIIQNYK